MPDLADDTALAHRIDALLAGGRRAIVGITGAPGAGKSTLAERVVAERGSLAVAVPMDGFHLANAELERIGRRSWKGAADTFDAAGYVALLARIREQPGDEIVYAPLFRREIEEAIASWIPVLPEHRLIVTEGNYLLLDASPWSRVRPLLDDVWYVDVDEDLRMERLLARHVRFGRTEAEARAWVARSDDVNARAIAATRERADLLVAAR